MRLHCPACDREVPADGVDLATLTARCPSCAQEFAFQVPGAAPGGPQPPPRAAAGTLVRGPGQRDAGPGQARVPVSPPRWLRTERDGKQLRLSWSWRSWELLPLLAFTAFWDGFMLVWYGAALSQGQLGPAIGGLLHLAVGVALAWASAAQLFNRTTVEVVDDRLVVRHGPVPVLTPRGTSLPLAEVQQLYARRKVEADGDEDFQLVALREDGRHERLVEGLDGSRLPLFLEQEIEAHLGLPDRAVPGELPRRTPVAALPGRPDRLGLPPGRGAPVSPRSSTGGATIQDQGAGPEQLSLGTVQVAADAPCPVCAEAVEDPATTCPACAGRYHPDCWDYAGGCATYGCGASG